MSELNDRYLACWNATDPATRRELIDALWAADATYTDPLADVRGRDQIDATIAAVQDQFPGFVFTTASDVDAHHNCARFTWSLGPHGAEPVVEGFDVVVLDAEGRIEAVHGFLDRVPA